MNDPLDCPAFASMYKALDAEAARGTDELSLLCGAGVSELRQWLRYAVSNNLATVGFGRRGPGAPRISYVRTANASERLSDLLRARFGPSAVNHMERFALCPPFSRIKPSDPISDEETRWFCRHHMHRIAPFLAYCKASPVVRGSGALPIHICNLLTNGPLPLRAIANQCPDPVAARRTVRKLDRTFNLLRRSGRSVRLSIELRPMLKFAKGEVI